MQGPVISWCIAVRNEVSTIAGVLSSILGSSLWGKASDNEVIICVNGSNDGTEMAVRRFAAERPDANIRLFVRERGSKGAAWNILTRATSRKADALIFCDGDVGFDATTFERLYETLRDDSNIDIVGALPWAANSSETGYGPLQRLIAGFLNSDVFAERRVNVGGICGQCYAIRRPAALEITLPENPSINEDAALSAELAGRHAVLPDARVYFVAPGFFDLVRQNARMKRSHRLIRLEHPQLAERMQSMLSGREKSRFADLRRLPPAMIPSALIWFLAGCLGSELARYYSLTGRNSWTETKSTKQLIHHEGFEQVHH